MSKDFNKPTFFDIGFRGYGKYSCTENGKKLKHYSVWENMLSRCYYTKNSRYNSYGGKGVIVCDDWLDLQKFSGWFYSNYIENWFLDKDLLSPESKVYSPKTCCFLPREVNNCFVITPKQKEGNKLPTGIIERNGVYIARVKNKRKQTKCLDEAKLFYKTNKEALVKCLADKYKKDLPLNVYNKLLSWEVNCE